MLRNQDTNRATNQPGVIDMQNRVDTEKFEQLKRELALGGTVKDAIEWARDLSAEVERLRAENARLNKENDDWHEASRKLSEEVQTKERTLETMCDALGRSHGQTQTARLALDVAQKEIERARAKGMEWMDRAVIAENKLMNPPPGAAT